MQKQIQLNSRVFVWGAFALTLSLWVGCGPMNQRPAADAAPVASPQAQELDAQSSLNGHFLISQTPLADSTQSLDEYEEVADAVTAPSPAKPLTLKKGENILRMFIYHANSDATVLPVSKDAQVTVEYTRAKSKLRRMHRAHAQMEADGGIVSTLHINKEGSWNIRVTITDGTKKDIHVIKAVAKF